MYQEFFWDFDGTLFDTYLGMVAAFVKTFKENGITLDEKEVYRRMRQTSLGKTFKFYADQNNLNDLDKLRSEYNEFELDLEKQMHPFEGVIEILDKIVKDGGHNYLMTHRNQSSIKMLEKFDLNQYFRDYVTAEKKFPRKPNPESLNSLVNKYSLDPTKCVMVGDRVLDIEAAHNAKMAGILFDPDDLIIEKVSPEYRIHKFVEISNLA